MTPFPYPGRLARRIVTGRCECVLEAVASKVDGHETNITRGLLQRRGALPLLALRVGMVYLEHGHVGEFRHPPRSPVQTGAEDHDLRRRGRPYLPVEGDGAGDHHLRSLVEHRVPHTFT
jgi:hypothetical protein